MFRKIREKIETTSWMLPVLFALASFLLFLPALFLVQLPMMDVLTRYAPMADAFAAGDWNTAFHPRVPPYLPVVGGIFSYLFSCSGFMGVKLASLLMFSLSFLALIPLFRRIFSLRTTIIGGILAMFCSHYLRLVVAGLRESGKGFFFTLGAYALVRIYQEKQKKTGFLLLGLACGGMIYVRDDSVLAAILFVLTAMMMEICRSRSFPWRTLLFSCCAAVVIAIPLLASNYRMTGYPVPSYRFIPIVSKFVPYSVFGEPEFRKELMRNEKKWAEQQKNLEEKWAAEFSAKEQTKESGKQEIRPRQFNDIAREVYRPEAENYLTPRHFLMAFSKMIQGGHIYFIFPALLVIVLRICKKQWKTEETILLLVPVLHALLIFLQVLIADGRAWLTERYLLALSPMMLCWAGIALEAVYDFTKKWLNNDPLHKKLTAAVSVLLLCLLYVDSISAEIRSWTSSRQRARQLLLYEWAELVRNDYKGETGEPYFYLDHKAYRSFRRPRIYSEEFTELGYFSGGETMSLLFIWGDTRESYMRMYDMASIHYGGIDYLAEEVPGDWDAVPEGFEIMDDRKDVGGKRCILLKRKDTMQ